MSASAATRPDGRGGRRAGGWPALRTAPVAPGGLGFGLLVAGCLAVLLGVPVLAWLGFGLLTTITGVEAVEAANGPAFDAPRLVLFVLLWSPVFSWAALPLAVPLAVAAARRGWAGWLVAVLAGAAVAPLAMLVATLAMGAPPSTGPLLSVPVGAVLGGAFWLGAKLARPGLLRRRPGRPEPGPGARPKRPHAARNDPEPSWLVPRPRPAIRARPA